MIKTSSGLLRSSSAIFEKCSEMFGNVRLAFGTILEKSSETYMVRNLRKIVRNVVISIRELTNRRLLHDAAVRLRDMLTAHAFLSTRQLRAKGDDVGESDLPASWKQEDVRLVFKVFSRYFGYSVLPDNLSITIEACP